MGGAALKNTPTRRYEKEEFLVITSELKSRLGLYFEKIDMPLYYRNKESFGDADFVVSTTHDGVFIANLIAAQFIPNEVFHNGNCWSFDYKEFQIDLIVVKPQDYDAMLMYLAYNDLGNMIGVIARGFGLKYGERGLKYDHYFKDQNIGEIIVSQDYPRIYNFLGLSYERFEEGFDDLTDIFEFVASSPYFNWKRYQFDQLNKINRDRNKKRKSYTTLLEWIDGNVAIDRFNDTKGAYEYEEDKDKYLQNINDTFPEGRLVHNIRRLEYEHCRDLYLKSKFNGGEIMSRYGLEGPELGKYMHGFKEHITAEMNLTWEQYLLGRSDRGVYVDFKIYLNHNKV